MTEWQPIETAPKDGTEILLYVENYCVEGKFIQENKYSWCQQVIELSDNWITYNGEVVYPTHWMPLPKPPEKPEKKYCRSQTFHSIHDNYGIWAQAVYSNSGYVSANYCPVCGEKADE